MRRLLPVHLEDLAAWPDKSLRRAMAALAPFDVALHVEGHGVGQWACFKCHDASGTFKIATAEEFNRTDGPPDAIAHGQLGDLDAAASQARTLAESDVRGPTARIAALVELDEGPRLVGYMVDCRPEGMAFGMKVRVSQPRSTIASSTSKSTNQAAAIC